MKSFFSIKLIIVLAAFAANASFTYAQDEGLDDLIRIVKRGDVEEKLEAAAKIQQMGPAAAKAEKQLLKTLKSNNVAKNGAQYVKALLAISEDHQKAYEAFERNALKQKGKKHEKLRKSANYFKELTVINPAPQSLVEYLKSLRSHKKFSAGSANSVLGQLVGNNPELAPQFVDELSADPLVNIRILANLGEEIKQYFPEIKTVMDKAPMDSLRLFAKYDAIDDEVLAFAISKAVMPDKKKDPFYGFNNATTWTVSLDVLAKSAGDSTAAKDKLSELLASGAWDDVINAISKHPETKELLSNEVNTVAFQKLAANRVDDRISGRSNHFDLCVVVAEQKINNPEYERTLLSRAKSVVDLGARNSCTYALKAVENPSNEVIKYLESALDGDFDRVLEKVQHLMVVSLSNKNSLSIRQFKQNMAPDLSPLYAAYVLLQLNPSHEKAKEVALQYYDSDLALLKYDRGQKYSAVKTKVEGFPTTISENGTFKALFAETTPLDVMALTYTNSPDEQHAIFNEGLASDNSARAINAARLLIDTQEVLENELDNLISKIQDEDLKPQSAIFIQALQYANQTDETLSLLKSISEETYVTRKNQAKSVLENLN